MNKVGTYGVASAQFHWGRMAALLLRILYYVFPQILWAFVFVDEFGILLAECQATMHAAAIIALLETLGLPISWKKTALGHICNWLGYLVDCPRTLAALTPEKQQLVHGVLRRLACPDAFHSLKYAEQAAGRLNWATMINYTSRPSLLYIFQWVAAMQRRAELQRSKAKHLPRAKIATKIMSRAPSAVVQASAHILRILSMPPSSQPALRYEQTSTIAAMDAGACEQRATIGGGSPTFWSKIKMKFIGS